MSRQVHDALYARNTAVGDLVDLVLRDVPGADYIEIKAVDLELNKKPGKLRAFLRARFGPVCVNPYCKERGNHDSHR
jgi:hypothetical protein